LNSYRQSLPAPGEAHPLVEQHYNELAALYESLQAAADGMPSQANRFSLIANRLGERLADGRSSLVGQIEALDSLANAASAPGQSAAIRRAPEWSDPDLDFHTPSSMPMADRLYLSGDAEGAARLYKAAFGVYDELGMVGDDAARIIAKRFRAASHLKAAQDYFAGMQSAPDPNVGVAKPITEAELAQIMQHPNLQLVKSTVGGSEPLFVMVGTKRVGVIKLPDPGMGGWAGLQGELAGARLANAIPGIDSPAAAPVMVPREWTGPGSFAVYKAAGETAAQAQGPTGHWADIVNAKDLQLVRATTEGPATYWVVQNGRKAGLFTPDWTGVTPADAQAICTRIAADAGGEIVGGQPVTGIKMTTPEVQGVFVRFVEGTDLGTLPEAQRIIMRRAVARDMVLRLIVGDYDGHGLNYKIGPNGRAFPFDRNLADVLAENPMALARALPGENALSTDPVVRQEQLTKLMKWRLDIMTGVDPLVQNRPLYQYLKQVHSHLTWEDFAETLQTLRSWDEAFIARQLGDAFGSQNARAAELIRARIECLDDVLSRFPKLPAAPAPSSASLPRVQPLLLKAAA
ncbi:MAG: hypothetical protein ACP5KN_08815, partial [Armatimonadota bacterium]